MHKIYIYGRPRSSCFNLASLYKGHKGKKHHLSGTSIIIAIGIILAEPCSQ
jgi:hypothetical protein